MASSKGCSFRSFVGSDCSFDRRDKKKSFDIVPLTTCKKEIANHRSTWKFSGVKSEEELILARAGMFCLEREERISLNICPYHRSELGVGWRRGRDTCRVPEVLSKHKPDKKGDRGIGKEASKSIFVQTGVLIPVGSGICKECRSRLEPQNAATLSQGTSNKTLNKNVVTGLTATTVQQDVDDLSRDIENISLNQNVVTGLTAATVQQDVDDLSRDIENIYLNKNVVTGLTATTVQQDVDELSRDIENISLDVDDDITFNLAAESKPIFQPHTPGSVYQPSSESSDECEELPEPSSREKLNNFLLSRDLSPIRNQLQRDWENVCVRTKRYYCKKAKEVVTAALEEIAPNDTEKLWNSIATLKSLEDDGNLDTTLLDALSECYNNATHWGTRRQILSIMADKVSFKVLQRWIPGLTRYRFNVARHHRLLHGRGSPLPTVCHSRMYVSTNQLDHFLDFITSSHIVQDLPFGTRTLKLSNKEEIRVPNVVRTVIPERIIQQYNVFCKETGFTTMGRSTLLRILNTCSASVRKSLQGLDYFSADGAKSFDDLEEVVQKIGDRGGVGLSWAKEKKEQLKIGKRYLKGDYKVHVSKNSTVADHCREYALSSPNDKDYCNVCDHNHDDTCDRCHSLSSVIIEIEDKLKQVTFSNDEKEELAFVVANAKSNINAWKAHLMRSVNQDECRLEILKSLDMKSALLVLDWAMKYLPRKFRESQTDWFGKRGIPWHITVAFRKVDGDKMETMTCVHIFEASNQDNCDVLAILNDVFCQLKSSNPELERVHLRQDNASCYHSALTIFTAYQAAKINDLHLQSMDFSDPQGGKGYCDRKAASIKSHMAAHLNSGHDIDTPTQMGQAIDSLGGMSGVEVRLCGPTDTKGCSNIKWPGVSLVNNIHFSEEGIKIWKAYNIGPGKSIPWKELDAPGKDKVPSILVSENSASTPSSSFVSVKPRKEARPKTRDHLQEEAEQTENTNDVSLDNQLFTCPEEGCIKTYQRYSSLQKHLDCGKHQRRLENETLYDRAVLGYAARLESGEAAVPTIMDSDLCHPSSAFSLQMGWALKSSTGRKRFSTKQTDYLKAIFNIGQQSGNKANPSSVSQAMRSAKDNDGRRLFNSDEFLTTKQIASFFSRLAAKRNAATDEDSDEELAEIERQSALQDLKEKVLTDISIQHCHPIVYESYNLCDMVKKSSLTKFSVFMLNTICQAFGLDTSSITAKRKKPYEVMITNLVLGCECARNEDK